MLENQNFESAPKTWWYMNTLLQLAIAYDKSGNSSMSLSIYKRALAIEPNCTWAKREVDKRSK